MIFNLTNYPWFSQNHTFLMFFTIIKIVFYIKNHMKNICDKILKSNRIWNGAFTKKFWILRSFSFIPLSTFLLCISSLTYLEHVWNSFCFRFLKYTNPFLILVIILHVLVLVPKTQKFKIVSKAVILKIVYQFFFLIFKFLKTKKEFLESVSTCPIIFFSILKIIIFLIFSN